MEFGINIESEEYSSSFKNRILALKALDELLNVEKFDDISVKEICERSCISRSMFYSYFSNKAAVIQWYVNFAMSKGVNKIGIHYDWFAGHLATTRAFEDFRHACYCALDSNSSSDMSLFFYKIRREALYEALSAHSIAVTPKLEFQIEAAIAGEIAATSKWFSKIPVKQLAGFLVSIVPRDLFDALDKPLSPRYF
jgi:AcrR family transcriptional regulator